MKFGDCVNRLQRAVEDYLGRALPFLRSSGLEIRMSQRYWRHQHLQQSYQQQQEYRRRRQQILVTFDRCLYRTDLELVAL